MAPCSSSSPARTCGGVRGGEVSREFQPGWVPFLAQRADLVADCGGAKQQLHRVETVQLRGELLNKQLLSGGRRCLRVSPRRQGLSPLPCAATSPPGETSSRSASCVARSAETITWLSTTRMGARGSSCPRICCSAASMMGEALSTSTYQRCTPGQCSRRRARATLSLFAPAARAGTNARRRTQSTRRRRAPAEGSADISRAQSESEVDEVGESLLHARHRAEHPLYHNLSGVDVCGEGRVRGELSAAARSAVVVPRVL